MKHCPFCAEEIQDAAIVCKHCGRNLESDKKTGGMMWGCAAVVALIVVVILIGALVGGNSGGTATHKLNVKVANNDFMLQITNVDSPEGGEMVVYINGMPPFTYKATTTVPAPGQPVRILLNQFVDRDGSRFNPLEKAVTEIWVGGGGFDYQKFGGN